MVILNILFTKNQFILLNKTLHRGEIFLFFCLPKPDLRRREGVGLGHREGKGWRASKGEGAGPQGLGCGQGEQQVE